MKHASICQDMWISKAWDFEDCKTSSNIIFGIKKLCKPLVFKYVFDFAMRLWICKLFRFKVVKGLFGHPVPWLPMLIPSPHPAYYPTLPLIYSFSNEMATIIFSSPCSLATTCFPELSMVTPSHFFPSFHHSSIWFTMHGDCPWWSHSSNLAQQCHPSRLRYVHSTIKWQQSFSHPLAHRQPTVLLNFPW